MASEEGHDAAVALLLEKGAGARIEGKDKAGCTALFRACQNGRDTVVPLLLKAGADQQTTRADGFTCLMTAVQSGYATVVAALTEFGGSSPDATRADGVTALILASRNGQHSCVQMLLAGKATASWAVPEPKDEGVKLAEPVGYTALHGASRMGRGASS